MGLSLGGGKNKSKTSATEQAKFSQTNTLSNRAAGLLTGGIADLKGQQYQGFGPASLAKFQDPYNQQVRDATLGQMEHGFAKDWNGVDDRLAQSGAFGDDRRGIIEAEVAGQHGRDRASMLAGLNQQGWQSALAAAMGENSERNQYELGTQDLIARLLAEFGKEGSSSGSSSGSSTGKSSGTNFGFSLSPFGPQK